MTEHLARSRVSPVSPSVGKTQTAPDLGPEDTACQVPVAEAPEPARVGRWFICVYMLTYFGLNLTMLMPTLFSVAYKVQMIDPGGKEASLGLVMGLGGLFGLVGGPVAGVLSDATRLRWGRRRPWLVGGLVLSALGALVIAMAPDILTTIAGFAVAQLGIAAVSAGFNPVLAERVPSAQRGTLGALGGASASLAGVAAYSLGGFLSGNLLVLFLLPVVIFGAVSVLFLLTVRDEPAPPGVRVPSASALVGSFVFSPRKYPDFSLVLVGKFLLQFGFTFFSTYQLYVLVDRLGFTTEQAGQQLAVVGGISLVAMMSFAVGGGMLSDRLRRRKPFVYGAAGLIAVGLCIASVAPDFTLYIVGGTLLAAGTGAFNSVDLAMATDLLPEQERAGKYMSIYYLASSVPATIAPFVAPVLLAVGAGPNYTLLFLSGAMLAAGAIITTWKIRSVR
ncbi:MFS transporter [Streptomyces collinus]|uniref:MFS transporter n=1 Tax=Streptomyces collinus TaxID=42684 RepID=UPI00367F0CAA